jgi:uncharacterized membrane protein YqjE
MARDLDVRSTEADNGQADEEPTVGELFGRVTGDLSTLFRQELELAKTEIKEEVTKAGKGAGMLSGAGIAGLYALMMLSFAAAWGLAETVSRGVAFLIMGVVWLAIAAALFVIGRRQLATAKPFPPEQTVETLKEDAQWAREQMK